MDQLQLDRLRDCLQIFDFKRLFIEELGWSQVRGARPIPITIADQTWEAKPIAELSGVLVLQIVGIPNRKLRLSIHQQLSQLYHEHILIFVDQTRSSAITQSLWLWGKRDGSKLTPREHLYVRGQPGDLFISKLAAMVVDINELDANGQFPLAQLVARLHHALDIEKVTKKFFKDYADEQSQFMELIEGIPNDKDRRWYASVLLNRLMFVWFLQRKLFLDGGNSNYLPDKLAACQQRAAGYFYQHFLPALFFEGLAKPIKQRSAEVKELIGNVCYLNGGLFLPHRLEQQYAGKVFIPDQAFINIFALFAKYSWNLNDTPGGKDNEINPDVLGYIFEKYINQKAFGAYYTRPEITEYLCERTIQRLILARVRDKGYLFTPPPNPLPLTGVHRSHAPRQCH